MMLKSQSMTCQLEDASADAKHSVRAGQYRVSERAIYYPAFPGKRYLPFEAVTVAWVKKTSLTLTGCCGKELPMYRLRLRYDGGEFYQDFLFETEAQARSVLNRVLTAYPNISQEETAG